MQQMPHPAPSAQGVLEKTPVVHLLVYIYERNLSGSLVLTSAAGERITAVFARGAPVKVELAPRDLFLAGILEELGFGDGPSLQATCEMAQRQSMRHGALLVKRGELTERKLDDALRVQLERKLARCFFMDGTTTFAYFNDVDVAPTCGGPSAPLDPLATIWVGVRQRPPWEHIQATLSRVANAAFFVGPNANVERLGLGPNELQAVRSMREAPRSMHDLLAARVLGSGALQPLIYALIITKQVEMREASAQAPAGPYLSPASAARPPTKSSGEFAPASAARPPTKSSGEFAPASAARPPTKSSGEFAPASAQSGVVLQRSASAPPPPLVKSAAAEPVPHQRASTSPGSMPPGSMRPSAISSLPPPLAPADLALRREIQGRALSIVKQNFFEMLVVDKNADKEAINQAFYALAKKWHPDRLPSTLENMRTDCATVFSHLSEAHQVLTDPQKRADYMRLLQDGSATPETQKQIQGVIEAAMLFQKAEVFLKIRDYAQAEAFGNMALEKDPRQADYMAFVTWMTAMRPEHQTLEPSKKLIESLSQAIRLSATCERAYYYRGMLYKRTDQHALAVKDFKRVAELNPNHVDAVREVRLFHMRGGKSNPPPAVAQGQPTARDALGGLFGKVFKK
jgi:tetratricopeptide (TPR) repeat protein